MRRARSLVETLPGTIQLLLAWLVLSLGVTARLPLDAPILSALAPSTDIACALLAIGFLAWGRVHLSARAIAVLCACSLITRAYLIADGIASHYLGRPFHLFSDLPLIPELVRLLHSIGGVFGVLAIAVALALFFIGLWRVLGWAWSIANRALVDPQPRRVLLAIVLSSLAISSARPHAHAGVLSPAVMPTVLNEVRDLLRVEGYYDDGSLTLRRAALLQKVAGTQLELSRVPIDRLSNEPMSVYVFLVEAYGHSIFTTPEYLQRLRPRLNAGLQQLTAAGFEVCSDALTAPTFGAGSWYTHATIETGVKVSDQFDYDTLLGLPSVPTLARMFRHAGYRAISVKPGTTRESPQTRFYGFDVEYSAASFDYRGPHYAWSPMPDQYVLQRIHAREHPTPHQPLFIEYALVSSHYPFSPLPPFIEDASLIGDGTVFRTLAPQAIPPPSPNVTAVASAYLASIDYDLHVVFDYIAHTIDDNALVLVLGDHQPTAGVAGPSPSWSVPIHVISKNPKLLRSWRALGCKPGLTPDSPEPHRGIETLIAQLVSDYGLSPNEAP
jgi:hypothetical protein